MKPHPGRLKRQREAAEMCRMGLTYRQISEATGKSRHTVFNYLKPLGLTPSRPASIQTTPNREKAIALRQRGLSSSQIATKLGISRERVCQYLRPLGMSKRTLISETLRPSIVEMDANGCTRMEISRTLGVCMQTVVKVLGPGDAGAAVSRFHLRRAERHVGMRFGRLTILSIHSIGKREQIRCVVRCDCGTVKELRLANVKNTSWREPSCGCVQREYLASGRVGRGKRSAGPGPLP